MNWADCNSAVASSVCEILPVDRVSGCATRQVSVSFDTRIAVALGNSLQLLCCVSNSCDVVFLSVIGWGGGWWMLFHHFWENLLEGVGIKPPQKDLNVYIPQNKALKSLKLFRYQC